MFELATHRTSIILAGIEASVQESISNPHSIYGNFNVFLNNVLRNSTPFKSGLVLTSASSLFRDWRASATTHGAESQCPTWWLQWNQQCWLSVSSHTHKVSRSWALITKAEITKPLQRLSTWIVSVFKADSLRKSSLVQPGGSGTSNCWGNEMQTDVSALALWASYTSSAPCTPHCRACAPQCSPSPGGCPKASHLGTAAYITSLLTNITCLKYWCIMN